MRLTDEAARAIMIAAGREPLDAYVNALTPWRCLCLTCGHIVIQRLNSVQQGKGCAFCAGNRVDPDEAAAVMLDAGFQPLEKYPGRHAVWRCKCLTCGRESSPTYGSIKTGGGCVWCARLRVDPDEAAAVMLDAGFQPLEKYPGNMKRWRCKCLTCERESSPAYGSIKKGHGCAWCAGNRVDPDEAAAVMLDAGFQPLEKYPGNTKRWRCKCLTCERESSLTYADTKNGHGCAWCARLRVDPDEAAAAMVDAGLEPLEGYPGALAKWRCRCASCRRVVTPTYGVIQQGGGGCAYCARNRVDPDEAAAVMLDAGFQPLEKYPGNQAGWRCRCVTCNRESRPQYASIRTGGGCRFCSTGGLDYTAPGIIYLMQHPELFCLKVGVSTTTAKEVRVDTHTKTGWVIIQAWDTPTGDDAEQVEQQVLAWWRNELGAPAALTKAEMPAGGYTETAALIHVDIDDTINRVNQLVSQLEDPASE